MRVARGLYGLRSQIQSTPLEVVNSNESLDETGLINAFGMYWSREKVLWTDKPSILGQQQYQSSPVNFYHQRGVYVLYDDRTVIYIGRIVDQPLGLRLKQHISDRLNGRWNRFSWFGIYPVKEDGSLETTPVDRFTTEALIVTMEALLIEILEPPNVATILELLNSYRPKILLYKKVKLSN